MKFTRLITISLALILTTSAYSATLIKNAVIHTAAGSVINKGRILFDDGKITGVGKKLAAPEGATVIDAQGQHLYPGLIATTTSMGLVEINALRQTRDYSEVGSYTPDVFAWIAVNPDSELIPVARANGITHFVPVPSGGTITGFSGVIAASGWTIEDMAQKPLAALHLFWPSMTLRTLPKEASSNPSSWKSVADQKKDQNKRIRSIKDFIAEAHAYHAAITANPDEQKRVPAWDAMIPVLKKELPIIVHADRSRQLRAILEFAEDTDLRIILAGGLEADLHAEALAEADIPVIYEHTFTQPHKAELPFDHHFTAAQRLHKAGVKVIISMGNSGFDSGLLRNLPYSAAQHIAHGLDSETALQMITHAPAQALGIDDTLGTIEKGKQASFFLSSGDIFDIRHNPTRMWINGSEVSLESRHTKLYNRYKARPKSK